MRIPEAVLNCVCFLGVRLADGPNVGKFYPLGTGFFVGLIDSGVDFGYLVTARHVLDEVKRGSFRDLVARINTHAGGAEYVRLPEYERWMRWENEAIDVALIPFATDPRVFSNQVLPSEMMAVSQLLSDNYIGAGDDLFTVGLFTLRAGKQRNIPIVRTGVIAAMPSNDEPFTRGGKQYHAYLAEMRSIGGLSGSPVFVYLDKQRIVRAKLPEGFQVGIFCLGLIRGHWDLERDTSSDVAMPADDVRLGFSKGEDLNTGIAVVTPADYIMGILNNNEVQEVRRQTIKALDAKNQPTEDAELRG